MRDDIRTPPVDPSAVAAAVKLSEESYARHEAGAEYGEILARLAEVTGQSVSKMDADAAFGSVDPETWARDLLLTDHRCPSDLTDAELLELLQAICTCDGEEWQMGWWLRCVEANTNCSDISGLVFYPKETLGPADGREDLTPEEILVEARRRPRRIIVTPPPKGDAA
jgi:hypothetical protein